MIKALYSLAFAVSLLLPFGAQAQIKSSVVVSGGGASASSVYSSLFLGGPEAWFDANGGDVGDAIACGSSGCGNPPSYWRSANTAEEREQARVEFEHRLAQNIRERAFACQDHENAIARYNDIAARAYFQFTHDASNAQSVLNEGLLAVAGARNHLRYCELSALGHSSH